MKYEKPGIRRPTYQVKDYRCQCGMPINIPINATLTDPFYVAKLAEEMEVLRSNFRKIASDLHELAVEALDHGLESSYLRTLDELNAMLRDMKERMDELRRCEEQ